MALSVVLKSDGTGTDSAVNYSLQATELQISLGRSPIQSPLPGGDPLLLDLGQVKPVIKISGTITTVAGTAGGNVIPSKRQLEDFIEAAYQSNLTIEITVGATTDRYTHKVASLVFSLPAAREDLYDFALTLAALKRVNV